MSPAAMEGEGAQLIETTHGLTWVGDAAVVVLCAVYAAVCGAVCGAVLRRANSC